MCSAMARLTPTSSMLAVIISVAMTTTAHFILLYLISSESSDLQRDSAWPPCGSRSWNTTLLPVDDT